ncbi:MAG: cupredoxin family copper-binding protein [Chthoniobacterales bacterium]
MINSLLRQPEYIHVLINPLPVYGLSMGLIALFVALCQRSQPATRAALVIVLISAGAAWPVYEFGEQAYDRVLSMSDEAGRAWLAAHQARAEHLIWFFYALAVLSAVALIVSFKRAKLWLVLSIVVLLLGVITLGLGGYIAYAGGKIRHREFRTEPPPGQSAASATEATPSAQPGGSVASAAAHVTIQALKYSPETIEIKAGETVLWQNKDLTPHTVTSQDGGELNSGSIEVGTSWSHTFAQPGTFPYFCTYHDEMKAVVVVK